MKANGLTARSMGQEKISISMEVNILGILEMGSLKDMGNIAGRMEATTKEPFLKVKNMGRESCSKSQH